MENRVLIVVAEWVSLLIGVIMLAVFWDQIYQSITKFWDGPITQEQTSEAISVGLCCLFLLNLILTCGVIKRSSFCCKIWFIINIIFIIIQLLDFLVTLSFIVFGLVFWKWFMLFRILVVTVKALLISYRVFAVYTIIDFTEQLWLYPIVSSTV